MRLFGLIGYPLTHSFSKAWFTEKFEREKITDCRYENFPILTIAQIQDVLRTYPDLKGLNVTIPYKRSVLYYLDDATEEVKKTGASNCILIDRGKLYGHNTDVIGFENSLIKYLQPHHKRALVLGTGGAAKAIEFVLRKLDIPFTSVSRNFSEQSITYAHVDDAVITNHTLIINATPVGMTDLAGEAPRIPYESLTKSHLLFDLIYNPEKTVFLRNGEQRGATIVNGYEMLVLQAEESWRLWNN